VSLRRGIAVATGVAVLAGLSLLLGSALTRPGSSSSASPLVGRPAPVLAGRTLAGSDFRLDRRPGRLTLVNIWASWCGPCRDELPLLARFSRKWAPRGVRLVTVNTKDGPVAARSFLDEVHARDLLTVTDPHGQLAVAWGATGVPETFVVDGRGTVRARWKGPVTQSWLEQQVRRWESR
jgi:cytochrome c biogenesis protein CcmG/thiol:disulfide interchange protein DsbE